MRTARDRIGPVDLAPGVRGKGGRDALARTRAEEEELTAAIARLKQATARLNREGRERLRRSRRWTAIPASCSCASSAAAGPSSG